MRVKKVYVDEDANREAFHKDLVNELNNRDGSLVENVKTPSTADKEFVVRHNLGRIPAQFPVESRTKGGVLYKSRPAKWTKDVAFLKYNQPSDTISIRFR